MARYKISLTIESDDDYTDGEQIESLKNDIQMRVADYNCFIIKKDVSVEEID
jgi:hypothetical protein